MSWSNVKRVDSSDVPVSKYVFEHENAVAEAVLYGYPDHKTRTVICCSTQSGCPVGCRFCGAGDSFVRSLGADEIVSQTVYMLADRHINAAAVGRMQIMFMSMGEPLLNQEALCAAIRRLHQLYPKAALLVSTIGPRVGYSPIFEVSMEVPTVGLQFSIHESTDDERNKLIPFAAKHTLEEIGQLGERWAEATGRRPFINYCAHDRNNSEEDADRLAVYFDPIIWEATISVICERTEHMAAANERQRALALGFQQKLVQRGFSTRCFDPAGQDDIGGGCGQLWFVQDWMNQHRDIARPSIGRGLPIVHTPTLEAVVGR